MFDAKFNGFEMLQLECAAVRPCTPHRSFVMELGIEKKLQLALFPSCVHARAPGSWVSCVMVARAAGDCGFA